MATRPAERLALALADRAIAHCVDCLHRAGVSSFQLAASHPIQGFARAFDTLVLEFHPQQPCDGDAAKSPPAQSPAELVREALVLLRALSACPGFAIHENFAFWHKALVRSSSALSDAIPVRRIRFPRIVLDWSPRYGPISMATHQSMLETSVLALFTIPRDHQLSSQGQDLLASVRPFSVASAQRTASSINCVVSLRFEQASSDTKALLDATIARAKAVTSAVPPIESDFTWIGVHVAGSESQRYVHRGLVSLANLRILHRACEKLAATIALDFKLPRSRARSRRRAASSLAMEHARPPFVAFVARAIGVLGTELLGRLAVLDLTQHSAVLWEPTPLDFAALCTLLPFSRSLQSLRVAFASKEDLLWLAYAAAHPLTAATPWRTLHLDCQNGLPVQWPQLQPLLESPSRLATLWSLFFVDPSISTVSPSAESSAGYYVRRTAKVASDVQFFSSDKTKPLVQLVNDCVVELCDTTTPLGELLLESGDPHLGDVAVVIAGIGLGWVHKHHLTQLTDIHHETAPRPCLTTFSLIGNCARASEMNNILSFFGASLTHLSAVLTEPFPVRDVVQLCPSLESLEMGISQWRNLDVRETPAMPMLQFVGLFCDEPSLAACSLWLQSLPNLRALRIRFQTSNSTRSWDVFDTHLATLVVAKASTLRSVTVILTGANNLLAFGKSDCLSCDAASKLAFLSVLRRVRDEPGAWGTVAQLDSNAVRQVFAFAGPSVTRRVVQGYTLWPSDWYDSLRNRC